MKFIIAPVFLVFALVTTQTFGQTSSAETPDPEAGVPMAEETLNQSVFGEAVKLERLVTSTTGMAISPLLGMGVLGLWEYLKTDAEFRADLPWYTNPWVWGVALGIFGLGIFKNTFGALVPELLTKPLSALSVLENKLSGLVVALAVIPASIAAQIPESAPLMESGHAPPLATMPLIAPIFLALPLLLLMFGAVWMAFHALRCLLLLSPSTIITSGILALKAMFLAGFAALSVLSPWLGIALSLVIVVFCIAISGWAFRWNVFGSIFAWDVLLSRFDTPLKDGEEISGFARPGLPGVKPRTYGTVRREGNELVFRFQPWLCLPSREVRVLLSNVRLGVRKGLAFPAITTRKAGEETYLSLIELRPRFKTHEDLIANNLQAEEILPSRVVQGARNALRWLREVVDSPMSSPRQLPG